MTDIDTDAIRQREQAADPAPWTAHPDGLVWSQLIGDPVSGSVLVENAEFIAHARQDIPALLAKVDELTADIDDRDSEISTLRQDLDLQTKAAWDNNSQVAELTAELADTHEAHVKTTREFDQYSVKTLDRLRDELAKANAALTQSRELADTRAVELADVWEQLTAANRRADGLNADLRSAVTANTAYANDLARVEREHSDTINDRDHAEQTADNLAEAIAKLTGVEIGEHSSMNNPWDNALQVATEKAEATR